MATPVYTRSEKLQRARLLAKGAKRPAATPAASSGSSTVSTRRPGTAASAKPQPTRRALDDRQGRSRHGPRAGALAPRQSGTAAREARRAAEKRLRLMERAAR